MLSLLIWRTCIMSSAFVCNLIRTDTYIILQVDTREQSQGHQEWVCVCCVCCFLYLCRWILLLNSYQFISYSYHNSYYNSYHIQYIFIIYNSYQSIWIHKREQLCSAWKYIMYDIFRPYFSYGVFRQDNIFEIWRMDIIQHLLKNLSMVKSLIQIHHGNTA